MEKVSLYCFESLALVGLLFLMYQTVMKMMNRGQKCNYPIPPGSTGLPFIGETLEFMSALKGDKGVYEFVRTRRARYGNSFKTKLFGKTQVFFSTSGSVKSILGSESATRFSKRYIKSVAELIGNQSILCASQQHHKLVRARLTNLFNGTSLPLFVKHFDRLVVENLKTWEHRDTVIVLDQALKITCEAMCKMLMSIESGYKLDILQKEVDTVCKAMLAFPIKIPGTRYYKGLQARGKIMRIIEKEISERRRGLFIGQHDDLLERLLNLDEMTSYDSANTQTLADEEIKDNILTMIIAGQDTTASAITWMVKYLDENQDVLLKLRDEQLQLSRKLTREEVSLDSLNDMSFASKVVKESLRMASIVAWFPRVSLSDTEIEGYGIKKGWIVNIDAKQVHLDPTVYDDPYTFNPSRWEEEAKPYSFLAFGMGSRTCLGTNMAKAMMLVFLYRLTTTYRWKVKDQDSSIEKWAMFSRLKSGCPVIVKRISKDTD